MQPPFDSSYWPHPGATRDIIKNAIADTEEVIAESKKLDCEELRQAIEVHARAQRETLERLLKYWN